MIDLSSYKVFQQNYVVTKKYTKRRLLHF